MQEKIKEIAMRIQAIRKLSDISESEMAAFLQIPIAQYKNYEAGNDDIPASLLLEIANKCGIEMTELLTGEQPRLDIYAITRAGKGTEVERRSEYKYKNLATLFRHKEVEPFLVVVEPESENSEIHPNSHPGQEFDYVLEGTLKVLINNNEVILEKGDSIYFDSSHKHGMQALGGKPARFLAIIT